MYSYIMNKETSYLGEVSPEYSNMMAITINISPHQYILEYHKHWKDLSPNKQYKYLKYIHKLIYLKNIVLLESDNKVAFEFCKSDELHSHGYYRFKDKYIGYGKYPIQISKQLLKQISTTSKYTACVKWVDNEKKWLDYLEKEGGSSGYNYYTAVNEPTINVHKDVCWYIGNLIKKEENDSERPIFL